MIDQDLINKIRKYIAHREPLSIELSEELLNNYIALIEQNAELHKELAKYRASLTTDYTLFDRPPVNLAILECK